LFHKVGKRYYIYNIVIA